MICQSRASYAAGAGVAVAAAPLVYMLSLMWWIPDGAKYVPGIVGGAILLYGVFWRLPERDQGLKRKQWPFLLAAWAFVVVSAASYLLNDGSWSELRALLVMAVYISFFCGVRFRSGFFTAILLVCAAGFITLTFYQYSQTGGRVGGFINPIPYSTAVGAVVLVLLAMLLFANISLWQRVAFGAIFVPLVAALLMTKTRGVVGPVFVICAGLLFTLLMQNERRRFLKSLIVIAILASVAVVAGKTFLTDRLSQTANEYEALSEGNYDGSFGVRLQLWQASGELIARKPVMGYGNGYRDALEELHRTGNLKESLYRFEANHFHNQFIDTTVKKGLIGGLALVLLLIAAARMVYLAPGATWQRYGGLSVVLLYAGASLTDVPLLHSQTIFLFFGLCFLLSSANRRDNVEALSVRQPD
ncbi:O-antigen ligase family protein [Marinobacter sp. 1-3A]|uniref:O-antigen ligase family protein n=1 Tax=Marinobacter sp. 1-3A TaxID=2582920 RepID=UPI001904A80C|nr:O-antigen ligase family protein [Marinobacter sp. 1-3A]MBK1874756.1 O-antigen ligase family protein [Marinobacter sp. 1-3A]